MQQDEENPENHVVIEAGWWHQRPMPEIDAMGQFVERGIDYAIRLGKRGPIKRGPTVMGHWARPHELEHTSVPKVRLGR